MRRLVVGAWWWLAACPRVATRAACEFWVEVDGSAYTVALPDRFPFGAAEAAEVIEKVSPGEERSLLGTGCADDAASPSGGPRSRVGVPRGGGDGGGCRRARLASVTGRLRVPANLVGSTATTLPRCGARIAVGRRDAWFCGGAAEGAARYRALQALQFEVPPPGRGARIRGWATRAPRRTGPWPTRPAACARMRTQRRIARRWRRGRCPPCSSAHRTARSPPGAAIVKARCCTSRSPRRRRPLLENGSPRTAAGASRTSTY